MKTLRSGFILIFALITLSVAIALTTYLFNQGTAHRFFARSVIDREKAQRLALGGVQVAMSQLAIKATDTAFSGQDATKLLKAVLPVINRWQSFELKEKTEGIDGKLHICVMCEDGKLDINQVYDFRNKKFAGQDQPRGDYRKLLQQLFIGMRPFVKDNDLFNEFERFMKARTRKLSDVTELLSIKEFSVFKDALFYEPPQSGADKQQRKRQIYLLDVLTVHSERSQIEPWLLSDSWCALLGLRRAQGGELKQRGTHRAEWLKDFKLHAAWSADWNRVLKPVYEREFSALPGGIEPFFTSQFEPRTFSVLSYGTVGSVTQRLYAIFERRPTQEKRSSSQFIVKKLYWI